MTRKEKFWEAYERYEADMSEKMEHIKAAKADGRKSDVMFWKALYDDAKFRAEHFYREWLNCTD